MKNCIETPLPLKTNVLLLPPSKGVPIEADAAATHDSRRSRSMNV